MGNNTNRYSTLPAYELSDMSNQPTQYNTRSDRSNTLQFTTAEDMPNICRIYFILHVFIAFFILLIGLNLHQVSYDEYALSRNIFGSVYSTPVYSQGIYLLSPMYTLEKFPATNTEVYFVSSVFSDTGLEFDIEIQFYYYFPKNKVYKIYNEFSLNYNTVILSRSKKTVKNLASLFSVRQFLQNRTKIEQTLSVGVYEDLSSQIGVIAPTEYFKIKSITFPPNIIANSLNSAIAIQNIELQINQQNVRATIADTQLIVSKINANATKILTNSIADSKYIKATADNSYQNIINSARSNGLQIIIKSNNIPNNLLPDFIKLMSLYDNSNKTIINGINTLKLI